MLEIQNVEVTYPGPPPFTAVKGIDLTVPTGSTVGLVGESGSGKSSIARAAIGLTPVTHGKILLDGEDVTNPKGRALRHLRGRAQLVFQDPHASLNPRMEIAMAVQEAVSVATGKRITSRECADAALDLLDKVGVPKAAVRRYPHQLSGGQLQRVSIARALALEPSLMILDEVTASLDVSVQARILNLLRQLQRELDVSMLYISHDLSVIRYLADHVYVMRHGEMVEAGTADQVFESPQQEYTKALLAAVPTLGGSRWRSRHDLAVS
ncbi:ATP-binding cassette domain-containing protein [Aeromicrobium sp. 636]|uniref:ABC transporter ATP-binding protein n=1 Tax=Aeromicrobium senzhongii TaxID=2663859 RepID=A0A8I0EW19_9ACTN|nr:MULTISPECIES: ABC transporter ATP-binding protein [Aeromicrobium]MBC9227446.1 ABC transporter ATP-binding protein [Aeromicrobium senzhongii]MCQ3999543.1 ATP-binding cassette domain-containing protein [Aeromicrobium sp. 636]MTB88144.1 ATP-binding cassette domain-containing protein [Aeromicrobium senzhongii]QNL94863.1 ABC transporter ATP-binding protein [Aeromicrobium senzhongii]